MPINKRPVVERFRRNENDTGSLTVQIALLTERINQLTEHFRVHKNDHHGRQGLLRLVRKRRRLINHLQRANHEAHKELIQALGLRD